jgi:hypothetical protein
MARFARGTTIRITADVTDYDNTYVTPTSIVVTVFQGATVKVNGLAMTTTGSTGKYYYLFQSATTDATGKYECKVTIVRNSRTSIEHDERAFYLY